MLHYSPVNCNIIQLEPATVVSACESNSQRPCIVLDVISFVEIRRVIEIDLLDDSILQIERLLILSSLVALL